MGSAGRRGRDGADGSSVGDSIEVDMNKPVCQSYCRGDAARNGLNGKKLASRNTTLSDQNIFSCPTPDLNPSQNFNPIQFSPKRQKFTHYIICWGANRPIFVIFGSAFWFLL